GRCRPEVFPPSSGLLPSAAEAWAVPGACDGREAGVAWVPVPAPPTTTSAWRPAGVWLRNDSRGVVAASVAQRLIDLEGERQAVAPLDVGALALADLREVRQEGADGGFEPEIRGRRGGVTRVVALDLDVLRPGEPRPDDRLAAADGEVVHPPV